MAQKFQKADVLGTREKALRLTEEEQKSLKIMKAMYQRVFGTPEGAMVFKDLMEKTKVFQTTMTGNSYTYFNEGCRSIGLHILHMREQGWANELVVMRKAFENTLIEEETDA